MAPTVVQLAGLQTEDRNPRSAHIDTVPTEELCRILNREDANVSAAVEKCVPVIAGAIDALSQRVRNGGRVFYIGAGTSGRLGVLDASEIPPTYSAPTGQFIALIAGGDHALRNAKEGAEDSKEGAEEDLRAQNLDPNVDSLIGIASSGRTPYVLGGLAYAKSLGCTTVGVVCVDPSSVGTEGNADYLIALVTGPEVVTGSTRMKAGTATKLALNMISTGIMIRLGKTYGNLMVDLKATNVKLKQRAKNILRVIGGSACPQSEEELEDILEACHGSVKVAAVVIVLKVSFAEAEHHLQRHNGVLARVFEEEHNKIARQENDDEGLVLCVDAGGTSCKAVVATPDGRTGNGTGGPCNVTSIGLDAAVAVISQAIQEALDSCEATRGRQLSSVNFTSAWVGMAGYDRPSLAPLIDAALSMLLKLRAGEQLKVTTDIDLLPISLVSRTDLESVVVLVAGTGSVAMSFGRKDGTFQRTGRVGGWGHLLGDDGSGYGMGRDALRLALYHADSVRMDPSENALPPLVQAILAHFQAQSPELKIEELLSTVLVPNPAEHQQEGHTSAPTQRIADVSRVVIRMANSDEGAKQIVETGAASLAQLVSLLVNGQRIKAATSGLVLAGGLMHDKQFRNLVVEKAQEKCGRFACIEAVQWPALEGSQYLIRSLGEEKN